MKQEVLWDLKNCTNQQEFTFSQLFFLNKKKTYARCMEELHRVIFNVCEAVLILEQPVRWSKVTLLLSVNTDNSLHFNLYFLQLSSNTELCIN